jgi:TetR/AcrR family acrAB operon transcriptional repressor
MMKRTREEVAETRRKILCVAEELFLQRGYESVSIREIAAVAGVSRAAVHWHFQSKTGLIIALGADICWHIYDLQERLVTGRLDNPLKALTETLEKAFWDLENDGRARRIMGIYCALEASATGNFFDEAGAFRRDMMNCLLGIFVASEHELSPPWTADTAANTLFFLLDGIFKERLREENTMSQSLSSHGSALVQTMLASCWSGVVAAKEVNLDVRG